MSNATEHIRVAATHGGIDERRRWEDGSAWQQDVDHITADMRRGQRAPTWLIRGKPGKLGWGLRTSVRGQITVGPIAFRPGKSANSWHIRRLEPDVVVARLNTAGHSLDAEIAGLFLIANTSVSYQARAGQRVAWHRAVELLVGHPDVFLENSRQRIEVVQRKVALSVTQGRDRSHLQVTVDGQPLPLTVVRHALDRHVSLKSAWFDLENNRLVVLVLTEEVLAAMRHIARKGSAMPLEAGPKLARSLASRVREAPLFIDRSLRGEQQVIDERLYVHLSWIDGLVVKVLVRPIANGAATAPAEGDAVWYGERDESLVWCKRNLDREEAIATQLWTAIFGKAPQDKTEGGTPCFVRRIRERDVALDAIKAIRKAQRSSALVDVVWDTTPVNVGGTFDELQINVSGSQGYFNATVCIGNQVVVPLVQAMEAIQQNHRYVKVADGSWRMLSARLRKKLGMLPQGFREQMALTAPQIDELEQAGLDVSGTDRWREVRDEIDKAQRWFPSPDPRLKAKLRAYQLDGLRWMLRLSRWAPGCLLADEMGLGKTVQSIGVLVARGDDGPALVVAPTSLLFNWRSELARFAPHLRPVMVRSVNAMDNLSVLGPRDVVLTTWTSLAIHIDRFASTPWKTLVLDEAQAAKNPETRRARAVMKLQRDFTIALTGTPMENRTGELWSVMRTVVPGLLGTKADYIKRFVIPIEKRGLPDPLRELSARVRPFILRRLKADVARELPPKTESTITVELPPSARRRYEALRQATRDALNSKEKRPKQLVFAALTRLRQLACDRRLVDLDHPSEGPKIQALRSIAGELASAGERALVFSQFSSLLDLCRRGLELDGLRCLQIDGRVTARRRAQIITSFEAGEVDVLLLSIKAAGVGLNLVDANYVLHMDPWWNPAVEDQATDRAHRIGQRKPVSVLRFVAKDTVEEKIYKLHRKKRDLLASVLDGTDAGAPLSWEDLRNLLDEGGSESHRQAA